MARTAEMRLIEMMALKQDVENVILHLGKKGNFQFQKKNRIVKSEDEEKIENIDAKYFESLQKVRSFLGIENLTDEEFTCVAATEADREAAGKIIASVENMEKIEEEKKADLTRISETYNEALSFSNLQIPYSQLEHLSFISLRIGRIPLDNLASLREALETHAVIIPLGTDKSKILAASSKKGRFALDTELKKYGFVNIEIPEDFKGLPAEVLESMVQEKNQAEKEVSKIIEEKNALLVLQIFLLYD